QLYGGVRVSGAGVLLERRGDAGFGHSGHRHRRGSGPDQRAGTSRRVVLYQFGSKRVLRFRRRFPLNHRLVHLGQKEWNAGHGGLGGTCTIVYDLNDKGQAVGQSTLTGDQAAHPFLWDRAACLIDLGTLGGDFGTASAINDYGEAVGGSYLPGNLQIDAMLWRKSGGKWRKTDLGTVDGANCSFGISINKSGQVVGDSGTDCGTLAFLWEDGGPIVDLNALVSPNSGIQLVEAGQINDRGEIALSGSDANGNTHAVLLIPCDEKHPGVEGCDYSLVDATTAAAQSAAPRYVPSGIQHPPQSRWSNRYQMPGLQSPSR